MYFLVDFVRETIAFYIRIAPYLLMGFFLAGALRILVPARWLAATFGKANLRSVVLASLAGVPLPLCSCSVLPTAVALRRSGASKGATVSFLISTPETGVDSISITYALLDPLMTVVRPIAAFVTAVVAGVAVNHTESRRPSESAEPAGPRPPEVAAFPPSPWRRPGRMLREIIDVAYVDLLDDISPYLFIGMILTGLIAAVVPVGALDTPLLSGLPSMLLMLVIGIPLYVCATGSTPIVAALIMKGLNPGAALVFLLAGPATNAAGVAVLQKVLGRRAVVTYLLAIALVSLLAGLLINSIYASSGIDAAAVVGSSAEIVPAWIQILAGLVLLALLWRSFIRIGLLGTWRERLRKLGRPLRIDLTGRAARAIVTLGILLLYLLTGCAVVNPGEVGWVLSFGRVTRTVTEAGLVFHWPYPFATFTKEQPLRIRSIDRGFRPGETASTTFSAYRGGPTARTLAKEAEVATGEETLLSIRYSIQYRIADPYIVRFGIDDADQLVTAFSEFALRRVMSEQCTDSVLVKHRQALELEVAETLRQDLARVNAGIEIVRADFIDVHAPPEVHFAFRDVASAMEDHDRFVHQAESYHNWMIASARGQSHKRNAKALGDKDLAIARARGAAHRFAALEEATRAARGISRLRMYLDAAGRLLPRTRVIIPLVDLPLDLWVTQQGTRGVQPWPEPSGVWQRTPAARMPQAPETTPADESGETWREKLERLQERNR